MEVAKGMKRNSVIAFFLLLSMNCCLHGTLVKAEEPGNKEENAVDIVFDTGLESLGKQSKALQDSLESHELSQFHSEDIASLLKYQNQRDKDEEGESEAKDLAEINNNKENIEDSTGEKDTGLKQLQIPQKLEVVIDPWEMDEKGQIYSEEYVIRNDSKTPGILTLSNLACKVSERSGAVVVSSQAGIHDGFEKLIYMQMIFGNDDKVVLSQENTAYEVELQPGEELSVGFEGEVNENAPEGWQNGDVAVSVVYSWQLKETSDDIDEKEAVLQDVDLRNEKEEVKEDEKGYRYIAENGKEVKENEEEEQEEQANTEKQEGKEISEDRGQIEEELTENEEQSGEELAEEREQSGEEFTEKKEPTDENEDLKVIKLQDRDMKPVEFVIDKWNEEEDGQFLSGQYLVKNEGEATGIFTLSDNFYVSADQNEMDSQTEQEKWKDSKSLAMDMKLVLENGEKIDFAQKVLDENPEGSGYKEVLRPGEEVKLRFVIIPEGEDLEELKKSDMVVKIIGSWDREERVSK